MSKEKTRKIKEDASTSEKLFDGVLFDTAIISQAIDCSGETFKSGWKCELGIELTLQSEGGRERKTLVFGAYKRNEANEILDLKYKTPVKELMIKAMKSKGLDFEVTEDWKLINSQVQQLVDMQVGLIVYCAGTYFKADDADKELLSWQIWDHFRPIGKEEDAKNTAKTELCDEFRASVDRGYPRNYVEDGLSAYRKFQREREENDEFKPPPKTNDNPESSDDLPDKSNDDMPW